jgi:hypothetical protein
LLIATPDLRQSLTLFNLLLIEKELRLKFNVAFLLHNQLTTSVSLIFSGIHFAKTLSHKWLPDPPAGG